MTNPSLMRLAVIALATVAALVTWWIVFQFGEATKLELALLLRREQATE